MVPKCGSGSVCEQEWIIANRAHVPALIPLELIAQLPGAAKGQQRS